MSLRRHTGACSEHVCCMYACVWKWSVRWREKEINFRVICVCWDREDITRCIVCLPRVNRAMQSHFDGKIASAWDAKSINFFRLRAIFLIRLNYYFCYFCPFQLSHVSILRIWIGALLIRKVLSENYSNENGWTHTDKVRKLEYIFHVNGYNLRSIDIHWHYCVICRIFNYLRW